MKKQNGWSWIKAILPATKLDIERLEKKLMAQIDEVISDVEEETTLEDSIITLLGSIQQQLKDALAGVTIPPAVQAKIDRAFSELEANKAKLTAALVANTPSAP